MVTAGLAGRPAIISGDRSGGTRQRLRSGSGAEPRESQPRAWPTKPGRWSFPRTRRYFTGFSLAGLTGALLFYCLSLTPSLLPRVWYLQAVMSGLPWPSAMPSGPSPGGCCDRCAAPGADLADDVPTGWGELARSAVLHGSARRRVGLEPEDSA